MTQRLFVYGYPALIPTADGGTIRGFVFSAPRLADFWPTLDEFEGEQYERLLLEAVLDDGSTVAAYVYALAKPLFPAGSATLPL